jgi:hypothetical protein
MYNDTFYIKNHGVSHRSDYFTRFIIEDLIWANTVTFRKWIEGTYVVTAQFPVIGTSSGDNLRVRSTLSLDGTIKGKLKKGELVYIVDHSLLPMTINNNTSLHRIQLPL